MTHLPWIIVCGLLLIISALLYHIGNLYKKADEVERWRNLAMQYNSDLHDMTGQRDAMLELKMFKATQAESQMQDRMLEEMGECDGCGMGDEPCGYCTTG